MFIKFTKSVIKHHTLSKATICLQDALHEDDLQNVPHGRDELQEDQKEAMGE